jgi:hypothetical protein
VDGDISVVSYWEKPSPLLHATRVAAFCWKAGHRFTPVGFSVPAQSIAYYFERATVYLSGMPFFNPKTLRETAEIYLDMIGYVRDERSRQILHELFEEHEAKAEIQEAALCNFRANSSGV